MHGCGTLIWADGDRYDGAWEDARPKGQGTFRWADGGMYIGDWCLDEDGAAMHAQGVYYPANGGPPVPASQEPCDAFTALLRELDVCEGKAASLMPWQKVLTYVARRRGRAEEAGVEVTADSNHGWRSSALSICSDLDGLVVVEEGGEETTRTVDRSSSCVPTPPRSGKKQGGTISKGHKNYELMFNLQLGIRSSIFLFALSLSLSLYSFLPIFSISFIFFWDTYVPTGMLWEGSSHRLRWISSHQHLIPKRRSGPDFLLKVQSTLLPTSHVIFGGRTTALWSSGQHYTISTRLELLLFAASCILCETNLFLCVII
jgi:hypothetical protein